MAGAIATATHGSGDGNGNLATAVAGLELLDARGDLVAVGRGDPDFEGMVVSLGALGVVTAVTLDVQPAFEVKQRVFQDLPWDDLAAGFDDLFGSGYSVSAFLRFGPAVDQLWVKQLADRPDPDPAVIGGTPAPVDPAPDGRAAGGGLHPAAGHRRLVGRPPSPTSGPMRCRRPVRRSSPSTSSTAAMPPGRSGPCGP